MKKYDAALLHQHLSREFGYRTVAGAVAVCCCKLGCTVLDFERASSVLGDIEG